MEGRTRLKISVLLPMIAKLSGAMFFVYIMIMNVTGGKNLPTVLMSNAGMIFSGIVSFLFASGAVSIITYRGSGNSGPRVSKFARGLVWLGIAMLLLGVPRSISEKERKVFRVAEFQGRDPNFLKGLSEIDFGRVTLASKGDNVLLSKKVDVEARVSMLEGYKLFHIKLFPVTRIGQWRLTVNQYGYAPFLEWMGPDGKPVVNSWIMLGSFPRQYGDSKLVDWIPPINLMLGVGYYPPARDDIFSIPGNPHRVYIRMEEATIKGVRRNLTDPEAHRFLSDGKPENPRYLIEIFKGNKRVLKKHLNAGEVARFPGGELRLSNNVLLWAEIQADRNPWIMAVGVGLYTLTAGLLLSMLALSMRIIGKLFKFIKD